ncbi:MAG: M56 family metallopeptidase [Cyanobacteria bacterium P01_A01_bin.45]
MHLLMILAVIGFSWLIRYLWEAPQGTHNEKWRQTLFSFLFPPLLIFMTAIALIDMGPQGKMGGLKTDWFSYVMAFASLGFFTWLCGKLTWKGWQSVKSALACPQIQVAGSNVRLLETKETFAAQIGFWNPKLVVSQGLIDILSQEQLKSVLAHEQGHYYYRDTFWFFWLGWVRSCTAWLPNTQELWEELIVLRELRADAYAAKQVDPIILAESLLLAVSSSPLSTDICCAALDSSSVRRLEQRVDALITPLELTSELISEPSFNFWKPYLLAFIPLVSILFHT